LSTLCSKVAVSALGENHIENIVIVPEMCQ